MARFTRNDKHESGVTAVETAFVMVFLMTLCLGMIETGSLFWSWVTTHKAAMQGVRFATTGQGEIEHTRLSDIKVEANSVLESLPAAEKKVDVRSWDGSAAMGSGFADNPGRPCDMVEVKVTYYYKPITPLVGSIFPSVIPLTASQRKVNEPWLPCD